MQVNAQVLVPTAETAFEPMHHFNPGLISSKGIRKITFEILDKKDFQTAEDKRLVEVYEFNNAGQLSRYYYTTISKTFERVVTVHNRKHHAVTTTYSDYLYDTVSTSYFYSGNNLILKRYHDGVDYYESRYYRYDTDGYLTKELRFRETNNSPIRSRFVLGNQVLLSEDSFMYVKFSSGQVKASLLNNENRPYKEKIINRNVRGKVVNIDESYTSAAWIRQQYHFEYKGDKVLRAKFEGNSGNEHALENVYEYDEKDELYGEKHYNNGTLVKEISYVTGKDDRMLNSVVIRDPINLTIRIIKLRYDTGMIGKQGE
jgi:hypothetical protein